MSSGAGVQPTSRVNPERAQRAVNSLLKWKSSNQESPNLRHVDHNDYIYLIVTLKKIPQQHPSSPFKLALPQPLLNPLEDFSQLCLFIDDRVKSKVTKEVAIKRIKSENIPISEVIKLSKLRTDYKSFEAKRKLCDSYDMFLADRRLIPDLLKLLGKHFKKKKIPVAIDLKQQNWNEQIEKVCNSTLFSFGSGTCSVIRVGKLSMGRKEISENVMAVVKGVGDIVPSKWKNIRSFHLKLLESLAFPIYEAVPNLKLKVETSKDCVGETNRELASDFVVEEAGGMNNKKNGMIHDDLIMNSNIIESFGEENFIERGDAGVKKSKSKSKIRDSSSNSNGPKGSRYYSLVRQ